MLNDSTGRKGAQAEIAGSAITGPARAWSDRAVYRRAQRQRVRNAAHGEHIRQIPEAIEILENHAERTHQPGVLEVLPERRVGFGNEEWIIARQCGDERWGESEVVFRPVTGAAGAAVPTERFLEEKTLAAPLGCIEWWCRRAPARERRNGADTEQEHEGGDPGPINHGGFPSVQCFEHGRLPDSASSADAGPRHQDARELLTRHCASLRRWRGWRRHATAGQSGTSGAAD